jgi:hypothetical protein
MPRYPALLAGCDVAALAGLIPFTRGATNITLPAAASMYDGGRYPDVVAWLTGYGSQAGRHLAGDIITAWAAAGGGTLAWEADITTDDRVRIRVPNASLGAWSLVATAGNAYGMPTGTTAASLVSGYRQVVGTLPWTRGNYDAGASPHSLTITDGVDTIGVSTITARVHSVPTMLRASTTTDEGVSPLTSLEDADNDAVDNADRRVRWGLDETGRVWTSYPSPTIDPIGWLSTTAGLAFRRLMGFTGSESPVVTGGRALLTATYVCPLVLPLSRGMTRYSQTLRTSAGLVELSSGRARGRHIGHCRQHGVGYTLRGPTHTTSDEGQALSACWPLLGRGQRVAISHDLGDPRRSRLLADLYDGTAVPAHSTAYTTEHLRGRVPGRVAGGSAADVAFGLDGARVRSDEVTLLVDEDA